MPPPYMNPLPSSWAFPPSRPLPLSEVAEVLRPRPDNPLALPHRHRGSASRWSAPERWPGRRRDSGAGTPDHGLRARHTGDPDRRVGLLLGQHPGVHKPVVVVLPLVAERAGSRPGLDYEVMGLIEQLTVEGGVGVVEQRSLPEPRTQPGTSRPPEIMSISASSSANRKGSATAEDCPAGQS